ncbi:MAG: ATP-binding protein [Polyangiales bacterium]
MSAKEPEELRRARRIANERLGQIELMEELSGVGYWRVTVSGAMTWSPAAFRVHGRDIADGHPSLEDAIQLYHVKDRRRVAKCLHRAFEEGGGYAFRARIQGADGALRTVSSAGRCECDANGSVLGIVGIVQDVTEQAEMKRTRARLERDDRLVGLGRLAAGVAHEINNPLAYVEINLRALKLDARETLASAPEWRDALQDCLDGVERIQTIVSELDTFGRPALDAEVHSLNDIAADAARLARSQLNITTELRLHLGEPSYIKGDKRRLAQVVLNLIRNADQALAPHPGRVEVFTQPHEGQAWLEVTDNGPGVPPELRQRIFEPFFTTKARSKGTGLGLALSAEIMRRHSGELSLVHRGSFGACFRLVMPEVKVGAQLEKLPSIPPLRKARILIVDDEEALLSAYRRLLQPNHTLETAGSGGCAIEILETHTNFDLIICDLMMPGMDGPTFFDAVQARWPHLVGRMVFSSGAAMSERARLFADKVGNHCVSKPIRPAELEEILAKVEGGECLQMSA